MMRFTAPELLWLALPWLLFVGWFFRRQDLVVDWIDGHLAPRFRALFTRYRRASLRIHAIWVSLAGGALIVALAGPSTAGSGHADSRGDVVLLIDASVSMKAVDGELAGRRAPRLVQAREIARQLVRALPERRFGLVSFSGIATIHLPLTADHAVLDESLRVLEEHTFYQNTGSRFGPALDKALRYRQDEGALQIVLLSDGEQPQEPDYHPVVKALAAAEVPVHTVAIGGLEGQERVIYDFRDIVAKKEKPGVLRRFTTRRVDHHLESIARHTDGIFRVASESSVADLAQAIDSYRGGRERVVTPEARRSFAGLCLAAFAVLFLLEGFYLPPRRWSTAMDFDLDRIGRPPEPAIQGRRGNRWRAGSSLLLLLLLGCSGSAWRAFLENEQGIARDDLGQHREARAHYERSLSYEIQAALPSHNLARSVLLTGDYVAAHGLFQETLQRDPELAAALYNHGVTLYRWGEAERDPQGCHQERTLELWGRASARFAEVPGDSPYAARARTNGDFLERRRAEIEAAMAESCPPPPEGAAGSGGEQGEGSGGGSGEGSASGGGPSGAPSPPPPLAPAEVETIEQAMERIRQQRLAEGKYFRRTLEEQFTRDQWAQPEAEIWW
ncbi:MAG: VWA domain-containing protein [Acidobacteriota bacterium]